MGKDQFNQLAKSEGKGFYIKNHNMQANHQGLANSMAFDQQMRAFNPEQFHSQYINNIMEEQQNPNHQLLNKISHMENSKGQRLSANQKRQLTS